MAGITVFDTYKQASPTLEKLLEITHDALIKIDGIGTGNGIELSCAVLLQAYGERYVFFTDDLDVGINPMDSDYATIQELVDGVRRYVALVETSNYGATPKPFIYTVLEVLEGLKFSDGDKQDLQRTIEELDLPPEEKKKAEIGLSAMFSDASPIRGLNQQEIADFDRLFYSGK